MKPVLKLSALIMCWAFIMTLAYGFSPVEKNRDNAQTFAKQSFVKKVSGVVKAELAKDKVDMQNDFKARYGDDWTIEYSSVSGCPSRIVGGSAATGLSSESSEDSIADWSKSFISKNNAFLGVDSKDLALKKVVKADERAYVLYEQKKDGLRVYGATLRMAMNQRGDLVKIDSKCFSEISYDSTSKLDAEAAAKIAVSKISKQDDASKIDYRILSEEKVIYPLGISGKDKFRLCHLLKIHLKEPLGNWIVVADANKSVDYVVYNDYRFGQVAGTSNGYILPNYYNDTPVSKPLTNQNIHGFSPTAVYSWNMDTNPGWSTQQSWVWGTPNGSGGTRLDKAPTSGHTGSNCYAYALNTGYENQMLITVYLTTNAINCSGLTGTHLSFWRWLGVDEGYYDYADLEVSNDGVNWTTIWENYYSEVMTSFKWTRCVYDISSVADGKSAVYVRWGMGPTSTLNTYCGWYIDDVEILANAPSSAVASNGNWTLNYSGTGNENIYGELSGGYRDVCNPDGDRFAFSDTLANGATSSILWDYPDLATVLTFDFTTNPGWTTTPQWAFGKPNGIDGDPSSGHTGNNVYGYNLNGKYENNLGQANYVTSNAINCSSYKDVHVRFWRWLGVEYYDNATFEVSNDNYNWKVVYINSDYLTLDTQWKQVTYNIASVADGKSTVYLRWGVGPTDGIENYCGWNIDDVEILANTATSKFEADIFDYDENNLFYHLGIARDKIKSIQSNFNGLDYRVPALVRVGTNYANAFWDGIGINMGEGDNSYLRNTALFSDVIYHEFNHGVTHQIYTDAELPYVDESGALDEAWSDYFACDITDEPLIGEGDLVIGEPYMRNMDNALKYPDDLAGEVHDDGRIVGGAFWDLRVALGSTLASNLIHYSRYNGGTNFFDYYEDVLLTDDTNGNINDGTPHQTAIVQSFANHGIGGVALTALVQQPTIKKYDNNKIDAGENGNLIPTIKAYFAASNVIASLSSTNPYVFINDGTMNLGNFIYKQEKFVTNDPMNIGISSSCPDDEIIDLDLNISATGGFSSSQKIYIINAPNQILYDDGYAQSYFGYGSEGGKFATRFTPPKYPIKLNSVRLFPRSSSAGATIELHVWDDNGTNGGPGTDLITPINVTVAGANSWEEFSLASPILQTVYTYNLTTNPGWITQGGWAFGTPTGNGGTYGYPDPTAGATGSNVYGYNLSGDYPNSMTTTEYLTTNAINCSGLTGVHLRFKRWLGVEDPTYDHAYIEVSNNGSTWVKIWENTSEVSDSSWTQLTYNISSVADNKPAVYVRWGMGPTDTSYAYCGWNIDDVEIVKTTGYGAVPSVADGDVYIGWVEGGTTYYNGITRMNTDNRSWVYESGAWSTLSSLDYNIDFLVRIRTDISSQTSANDMWNKYE